MESIEIKVENVKGIIKHYEKMLNVVKTDVQKEFYTKQIELYKSLIGEDVQEMDEVDQRTLEAVQNSDVSEWKNKVFKIEIDQDNKQIKVISKRKAMKGKGFIIPLFEELKTLSNVYLEKFIWSKYTTEIYKYC